MMDSIQKDSLFVLDDRDTAQRLKEFKAYCENIPFQIQTAPTHKAGPADEKDSINQPAKLDKKPKNWGEILFADKNPEELARLFDGLDLPNGNLSPHQAFLLAFYKLLETPRRLFNAFPEAHRQLYYRQVLGFAEHGIVPDKVMVYCRLTDNTKELLLPKGLELDAGQDSQGTPRRYQLDADLLANQSQWTDLRWVLPDTQALGQKQVNEQEVVQHTRVLFDKRGSIPWPQDGGIRLFSEDDTHEIALQGRIVSSPVLMMSGGTRTVTVTLDADMPKEARFTTQLSSGGKWLTVNSVYSTVDKDDPKTKTKIKALVLTVPPELGPITPAPGLDGYPLTGPMATAPLLKITRADGKPVPKIQSIEVDVKDLPNVLMSTDEGLALINKKSYPFGPQPRIGSGFNLVASDWYNNPFKIELTLTPQWAELPPKPFQNWYEGYGDEHKVVNGEQSNVSGSDEHKIKNDEQFKVSGGVCLMGNKELVGLVPLFKSNEGNKPPVGANISIAIPSQERVQEMPPTLPHSRDPKDWPRWVRVELREQDFLHAEYPQKLVELQHATTVTVTKTINADKSESWTSQVNSPKEINPPYTPQWQSLQVCYKSTDSTVSNNQYLLTPFGHRKDDAQTPDDTHAKSPQLYLGFTGIKPGQDLNLYWKLQSPCKLEVQWQYLHADNTWRSLNDIVDDHTHGLFESGLWLSPLPDAAAESAPWMPLGRYWIRGVVTLPTSSETHIPSSSEAEGKAPSDYPLLKDLYTNSSTATLVDGDTLEAVHFASSLPAFTITRTVKPINGIQAIVQPESSYDGRGPESEPAFLKRVANHLENRGRVLTWRDVTTLLIEKYPEVYDVRVVEQTLHAEHADENDKQADKDHEYSLQSLVVIPASGKMDNNDPLKPAFNPARLERMGDFLCSIGSPWLKLQLKNPQYTKVHVIKAEVPKAEISKAEISKAPKNEDYPQIVYDVAFKSHVNADYAQRQLKQALERQYMPWASDGTSPVKIGSQIDKFEMIKFIQQLEIVERVNQLTIKGSKENEQTTIAGSSTEVLILTFEK